MNPKFDQINRLLNNIKLTSDNIDMSECYYLCANREHVDELKSHEPQVVWGRRGTGKTTLLKAFSYQINYVDCNPEAHSIYTVIAQIIPTEDELDIVNSSESSLAVYIFSKLVMAICNSLGEEYNLRKDVLSSDEDEKFISNFDELVDYLRNCQRAATGSKITINNSTTDQIVNDKEKGIGFNGALQALLNLSFYWKRNKKTQNTTTSAFAISGEVKFTLDTSILVQHISEMTRALRIKLLYICIDEYSEMDKLSDFSIQSTVAQMIKQVFFKSSLFSVKIATIWNATKLHSKGNRVKGIEYLQDIFQGPDLDIMFISNNIDIVKYFKRMIVNTYYLEQQTSPLEKEAIGDWFEKEVFGETGFRHLICGSQGISRAFLSLVKKYLRKYNENNDGKAVKLGDVYDLIKQQYIEDVRYKIPTEYKVYNAIDNHIVANQCRYFLITRKDYRRCKDIIKYLSSRGMFMQIPGQNTPRKIRNSYKLFIIHYGNYLDALDSVRLGNGGRKKLDEDSKLENNGKLIPDYDENMYSCPEKFTVDIPADAEKEVYCSDCKKIFVQQNKSNKVKCPFCNKEMLRYEAFLDQLTF